ncbi:MAG: hypothetical protein EAZ89_20165 [Bacteroidetes bacterium]|nr:MAG: hypothetical protein EAZ89_20165 [Bacteroidota bacterium]
MYTRAAELGGELIINSKKDKGTVVKVEVPVKAKFLIEAGAEYGGDEILKVFFTNGGDQSVRAGQGGFLAAGGQIEFTRVKNLMIRTAIGIKYNTTAADDANIRLTRFPFTLMPYWRIRNDFRVGAGITTHIGPKLNGDGFFPDVTFTSNLGPRFEVGYKWVGITYTALAYKTSNGTSYGAGSLGASFSFTLPDKP